jgi:DNA-binding IclR family transcriptional regulator
MMMNELSTEIDDDNSRKYRAPALEKGLDILELLARNDSPMTTSQLAATLERSVSELFRMVLVLEFRGYIEPSPDGRDGYVLSNKLFTLGISQGSARSLLETALPVMKEIARELGQSCHLVVPSGDQIVVVGRIESPMDLGFSVRVGYRRRFVDTNSGLLLYGYAPDEAKARWLPQLQASAEPERIERFLQKSKAAQAQGWVEAVSEFVDGVTDLCVPILGMHGATAVLSVPFIAIKAQPTTHAQVIERLKIGAKKIAEILSNEGR